MQQAAVDGLVRQAMRSIYVTFLLSILGGIGIGVNSFCTSTFTEILARGLLMGEGEAGFWVGMVATGFGVTYCISPVLFGHVSDRIGRRVSLAIAMAGFAMTNVGVLLATEPVHLVIANAITGLCYGLFWSPIEAYLSEMTEYISQRLHARSLSIYLVCWSVGLTAGPFIGGMLDAAGDVTFGFVLLAIVAAAAVLLSIKFIFTTETIAAFKRQSRKVDDVVVSDRISGAKGKYLVYLKVAIAFSAIYFAFTNQILQRIFPALAKQGYMAPGLLFAGMDPALTAGTLIFFLGIGRTITLWHSGVVSPLARERLLLVFAIGIPVANMFIYLFPVADALLVSFVVYGFFNGYAYCIGIILLMELSKTGKGLRAGIYEAAIGIGFLASTFTSSLVIPIDPALPFLLGTLVATGLTIVLLALLAWSKMARS